ncbi:4-hydroxybenzoate transporter [Aquitalea magnusonii]|nr:4-hydroxybenzoate transporter [Aquitalea magnusonii]
MSNASNVINVRSLIDDRPINRFQWLVVFFGFCIIAADGFDVAIMGFIAPELKRLWHVTNPQLAPVLSAALAGLTLGALFAGPLADYLGRKVVLVLSVFFFGFWTLVTATSTDITHLVIFRFLTGLGLGAAMPNVGTLVSEFAPERRRSFLVTVVFCGFTVGAAGGGFLSAWMIPHFGWQSVLIFGGVLPIAVSIALLLFLPESVRFMVVRNAPAARIAKIVQRLAPDLSMKDASFTMGNADAAPKGNSIRTVLSRQYRFGSFMLWLGYFMALFVVYLMGSWMPTLVKESGYTLADAAFIAAFFQFGGPAGSLFMGWCMDRANPHKVLAITYGLGAVLLFGFTSVAHELPLLCALTFAVGFCFNGANTGMNALSAGFYPTAARATGSSWMHGVGRIGAVLSAFAGGQMLAWGWTFSQVFAALAVPAGIIVLSLLLKNLASKGLPVQPVSAASKAMHH